MNPGTARSEVNNTKTVARNSVWYGIEMGTVFVIALVTSVIMARVLGPQKLGYFTYVQWLASLSRAIGSVGIPNTTRKYMAEYLGRGEPGIAGAIFWRTLRIQNLAALVITGAAVTLVVFFGDPAHRLVSLVQVIAILPAMAAFVPAQANTARENLKANVGASVVGSFLYLIGVVVSLWAGWDLLGIAATFVVSRAVEYLVRTVPVIRWVKTLPKAALPQELRGRMLSFSGQSTVLLLLDFVVWNRSDVVFLKILSKDIAQVTFFSVAFNLAERAMVVPETFGSALGATIMAQYGRDRTKLRGLVSSAARYVLLFSLPLLLGLAAVSAPAIRLIYGTQYLPAIPVLAVVAIFAIPKAMLLPAQHLLQAGEKQGFLVWWGCLCGITNVLLDLLLIPHLAAVGAAIANGAAQSLAAIGIWVCAIRVFRLRLDSWTMVRASAAAIGMAVCILPLATYFRPVFALPVCILVGAAMFAFSVRLGRVLRGEDWHRLAQLESSLPSLARVAYRRVLRWVAGGKMPVATLDSTPAMVDAVD